MFFITHSFKTTQSLACSSLHYTMLSVLSVHIKALTPIAFTMCVCVCVCVCLCVSVGVCLLISDVGNVLFNRVFNIYIFQLILHIMQSTSYHGTVYYIATS